MIDGQHAGAMVAGEEGDPQPQTPPHPPVYVGAGGDGPPLAVGAGVAGAGDVGPGVAGGILPAGPPPAAGPPGAGGMVSAAAAGAAGVGLGAADAGTVPAAGAPPAVGDGGAGGGAAAPLSRGNRHFGLLICGNNSRYVKEANRLMRSLVLTLTARYSKASHAYHLWILSDKEAEDLLKPSVRKLQSVASRSGDAKKQMLNISFLNVGALDVKYGDTMNLFARCCMVPIFVHELVPPDVKEIQLLGADQVFVDDPEHSWAEAKKMGWDGTKMFAAPEECVEPRGRCGYYNLDAHRREGIPKFGHNGLNAGSILYSLENMRKYGFSQWAVRAAKTNTLELGDQSIVNIFAKEHPERVSLRQCNVNVRTDSGCDVDKTSPIILHGNRHAFENIPQWKAFGDKVDALYELLESKGEKELPGTSIWTGVGKDTRNGLRITLRKPWGLSPLSAPDLLKPCENRSLSVSD